MFIILDWSHTSSNKKRSAFRVQRSEKIKKVAQNAERGAQNAMLSEDEEWHQKDEEKQVVDIFTPLKESWHWQQWLWWAGLFLAVWLRFKLLVFQLQAE